MSIQDRVRETFGSAEASWLQTEDTLELIGVAAGVFVALVGVGTLVGMPWSHHSSLAITLGRIVGTLGTIAVGVAIVWLVRTQR